MFYLARPAGKRVPWDRGCRRGFMGRDGQGWQGHPRQSVLRGPVWALPPVGSSAGEFPSGRGGCLGLSLLIFLAVTQGFQELEG